MTGRARLVLAAVVAVVALSAGTGVAVRSRPAGGVPAAADFVPIARAPVLPADPPATPDASPGSFTSPCGVNAEGHLNADNVVTSPGRPQAAGHEHEYVGNLSTDAFATDSSLAAAATTCANGDLSTYSWPVLRVLGDRTADNHGARIVPASVTVTFVGNPVSRVVAMPRFLRVVTGNAKAVTAGAAAGVIRTRWSCSGSPDRATNRYPLCPDGQRVVRTFVFPGCWDGRRTDSPTHRDHVVFAAGDGSCPHDTFPVPQLRIQVAYRVPPGRGFVIDTAPEQRHSPITDHADFIDVMPDPLMAQVVACLNEGRRC